MTLEGRVALITGASQGIGQAIAVRLAAAGASVALAARNQDKLNEVVQQITSAGGKASAFQLDVADEEQIKSVFKAAIAQLGKIDILVNNAGITRDQLVMRMKRADWDAVLGTNLTSAYLCTQQVIESHAQTALGPHYQRHQHLRPDRAGWAGELCIFKSRLDRPDQSDRSRTRIAQHHLQCGGTRFH